MRDGNALLMCSLICATAIRCESSSFEKVSIFLCSLFTNAVYGAIVSFNLKKKKKKQMKKIRRRNKERRKQKEMKFTVGRFEEVRS